MINSIEFSNEFEWNFPSKFLILSKINEVKRKGFQFHVLT